MRIVDLGCIYICAYNFFVSGPKFTSFIYNAEGIPLNEVFFCFQYMDQFLRYLRSKLKVVLNRAEFWTFFALPNFKWAVPPKCCI